MHDMINREWMWRGEVGVENGDVVEAATTTNLRIQGFRFIILFPRKYDNELIILAIKLNLLYCTELLLIQGKGDGSYSNGGGYRHQDEGDVSGGEDDKKAQGESSTSSTRVFRAIRPPLVSAS